MTVGETKLNSTVLNNERKMDMNMKTIIIVGLLLMIAGISACSARVGAANEGQGNGGLSADYENALPVEMQLAVGSLALDGSENAIDAEEASELLPLWKAISSLSQSDSVAAEEIQAVFNQIEVTMTPEQVEAIAAMQLTREDMTQLAEEMGINFGGGAGRFGELTPEMQATIEAARESGEFPQGGFPAGGGPGGGGLPGGGFSGGGGPGGELTPEQQATAQARRASGGGASIAVPPMVAEAVIEYLEARVE
jgi:hypothetical protein